jgi:hypothetical protein
VFKRWDTLTAADAPEVVVFFARSDILSGLFTLANFDQVTSHGVVAPFAAGCGSIVQYPYLERYAEMPRAILGMFDVSADLRAVDVLIRRAHAATRGHGVKRKFPDHPIVGESTSAP